MNKDWKTVEVLQHSRHDWLNRLQLIKANIDLNRIDHVKAIIEDIIIETQNESKLSNLNMPEFVETLLTANWRSFLFRVEFEVISLKPDCGPLDDFMASWIENLFDCLSQTLGGYGENVLFVAIDENKQQNLRLSFELQGTIENESTLFDFLHESHEKTISTEVTYFSNDEVHFYMEIIENEK
ncbi:Spo0B domain-containing protein [Bacillus sp. V5-8f]|uniref:Spo0B domain-containing protein n=1 Tax=Bacillus sp. V5-8f TaxID=2053044 RepID=UPI000C782A6D|nr:Spo0B domain-containing protein [Bacillus sp. V5-8f]PLT32410.1 sporulation protein [Bacillus sp. V5-8f]